MSDDYLTKATARKRNRPQSEGWRFQDENFLELCPMLSHLLGREKLEDGSAHLGASLSIFVDLGVLKYCLTDKTSGALGWGTLEPSESWADQVEQDLVSGKIDWREPKQRK